MRGPPLSPAEAAAVDALLERAAAMAWPPLAHAALFGSRARRDHDRSSDVDVLLVCRVAPWNRAAAASIHLALAEEVSRATGVPIEPWTVASADLARGSRTPMLVDAVADSIPLWPAGAPPLRAPFTPADAVFCAQRLLEWVEAGGADAKRALIEGRWADAARRARDDITRLATAALLLTGDTRHRRIGSLRRFEQVFVCTGRVSAGVLAALRWAEAAFPPDGGRGQEDPAAMPGAVRTADRGCRLAAVLEAELVIPLLGRAAALAARQ